MRRQRATRRGAAEGRAPPRPATLGVSDNVCATRRRGARAGAGRCHLLQRHNNNICDNRKISGRGGASRPRGVPRRRPRGRPDQADARRRGKGKGSLPACFRGRPAAPRAACTLAKFMREARVSPSLTQPRPARSGTLREKIADPRGCGGPRPLHLHTAPLHCHHRGIPANSAADTRFVTA